MSGGGNGRTRTGRVLVGAALVAALVAAAYFVLRPVCVAIDDETLARFNPPIETRRETTFYGTAIFRQEEGRWYQCKTWISRQFFF